MKREDFRKNLKKCRDLTDLKILQDMCEEQGWGKEGEDTTEVVWWLREILDPRVKFMQDVYYKEESMSVCFNTAIHHPYFLAVGMAWYDPTTGTVAESVYFYRQPKNKSVKGYVIRKVVKKILPFLESWRGVVDGMKKGR